MLLSNLVYKFKCNMWNDSYYGKTKQHFKVSLWELEYHALKWEKGKSTKESAVFDHIASFDDFETLVKECDESRLLLRVSLLILYDDPPFFITIFKLVSLFRLLLQLFW